MPQRDIILDSGYNYVMLEFILLLAHDIRHDFNYGRWSATLIEFINSDENEYIHFLRKHVKGGGVGDPIMVPKHVDVSVHEEKLDGNILYRYKKIYETTEPFMMKLDNIEELKKGFFELLFFTLGYIGEDYTVEGLESAFIISKEVLYNNFEQPVNQEYINGIDILFCCMTETFKYLVLTEKNPLDILADDKYYRIVVTLFVIFNYGSSVLQEFVTLTGLTESEKQELFELHPQLHILTDIYNNIIVNECSQGVLLDINKSPMSGGVGKRKSLNQLPEDLERAGRIKSKYYEIFNTYFAVDRPYTPEEYHNILGIKDTTPILGIKNAILSYAGLPMTAGELQEGQEIHERMVQASKKVLDDYRRRVEEGQKKEAELSANKLAKLRETLARIAEEAAEAEAEEEVDPERKYNIPLANKMLIIVRNKLIELLSGCDLQADKTGGLNLLIKKLYDNHKKMLSGSMGINIITPNIDNKLMAIFSLFLEDDAKKYTSEIPELIHIKNLDDANFNYVKNLIWEPGINDRSYIINNAAPIKNLWNNPPPVNPSFNKYIVCPISSIIDAGEFGSCNSTNAQSNPPMDDNVRVLEKGEMDVNITSKFNTNSIRYHVITNIKSGTIISVAYELIFDGPTDNDKYTFTHTAEIDYSKNTRTTPAKLSVSETYRALCETVLKTFSEDKKSIWDDLLGKKDFFEKVVGVLLRKSLGDLLQEFNGILKKGGYKNTPTYNPVSKPVYGFNSDNAVRCVLSNDIPSAVRIIFLRLFLPPNVINKSGFGGFISKQGDEKNIFILPRYIVNNFPQAGGSKKKSKKSKKSKKTIKHKKKSNKTIQHKKNPNKLKKTIKHKRKHKLTQKK